MYQSQSSLLRIKELQQACFRFRSCGESHESKVSPWQTAADSPAAVRSVHACALEVPETPLAQLHQQFKTLGVRVVFLVHRGRLAGLITKKNFLKVAQRTVHGWTHFSGGATGQ